MLSFTVCKSSARGRVLEEPARDSGVALDCMLALLADTSAWTASLGVGGRLLRSRNGEDDTERKRCLFCRWSNSDILWSNQGYPSIPPYVTGKGNPSNPSAARVPRCDPVVGICGAVSNSKLGNLCLVYMKIALGLLFM